MRNIDPLAASNLERRDRITRGARLSPRLRLGNRRLMRYTTSVFLILASLAAGLAQSDEVRYSYRVSGKVIFKKHQSPTGATVYVLGTRPINGRIPWAHAAKDGTFSIDFTDVPENFHVCAHPGKSGGMFPLAGRPEEAQTMASKLSCTGDFRLDADHREERVEVKLK